MAGGLGCAPLLLRAHRRRPGLPARPGIAHGRSARRVSRARLLVLALVAAAVVVFFAAGGQRYLSFEYVKSQQAAVDAWYQANPWRAGAAFFALYVVVTGLSLPGAALMTLIAGALFGLLWGTLIVSFASTLGATLAFFLSRFLLRDWVQERFRAQLAGINRG